MELILYGTGEEKFKANYTGQHSSYECETAYEGVIPNLERRYHESKRGDYNFEIGLAVFTLVCLSGTIYVLFFT